MLEIQWLRVMGRISKKLSFGGLEPLDSGLLVTYILVCKCAELPLRILPEITKIPVTVGIGHAPVRASAVGFINLLVDVVG